MLNSALKQRMANLETRGRIALLALLLATVCLMVVPIAYSLGKFDGVAAAALAATVVWFASALGMALGHLFHGSSQALRNLLVSMVIRMIIPLVACLLALLTASRLAQAGFEFYVLVFYLVALPVDTMFAVFGQSNSKITSGA